jgi:hypothetical protein
LTLAALAVNWGLFGTLPGNPFYKLPQILESYRSKFPHES